MATKISYIKYDFITDDEGRPCPIKYSYCSKCGEKFYSNTMKCPHCGATFESEEIHEY